MVKILNLEPDGFPAEAKDILRALGALEEARLSRAELLQRIAGYDVVLPGLAHRIDAEVIAAADRLKVIASNTTGLDHIDLAAAEARGIAVLSLRDETAFLETVSASAEHSWALLLALARRLIPASRAALRGEWQRAPFIGNELAGRRLGIVGLGRNGAKVARYGAAFGMEIHAFDPRPAGAPGATTLHRSLDSLLAVADVLTLHVPLTPATQRLIGDAELERLPQGALLVNTSRGEVLDEEALLRALESGHLAGAALDVLAGATGEGVGIEHPLLAYARQRDNLIVTPHIAGSTKESRAKTAIFIAEKLRRHLDNGG